MSFHKTCFEQKKICLTPDEAKQVLEMVEYYIDEEQLVGEEESLDEVNMELAIIVKKLMGITNPKMKLRWEN